MCYHSSWRRGRLAPFLRSLVRRLLFPCTWLAAVKVCGSTPFVPFLLAFPPFSCTFCVNLFQDLTEGCVDFRVEAAGEVEEVGEVMMGLDGLVDGAGFG